MDRFKIGDQVLVALDVLGIYAEDTPIPDDPRSIRKGTLVLGYAEEPKGDRITAMPEMVRAVSPAPAGEELREVMVPILRSYLNKDDEVLTLDAAWRLSGRLADTVMAVLNGEGSGDE